MITKNYDTFDLAWTASHEYHRVSDTVRVVIQTRIANIYTYVEDFIVDGDRRRWKIRSGSIRSHGCEAEREYWQVPPRLKAKARAETLWHELRAS